MGADSLEIDCTISNLIKNKIGNLKLSINNAHDQLNWQLKNREGLKIGTYDFDFSYPLTLTLYRIEWFEEKDRLKKH